MEPRASEELAGPAAVRRATNGGREDPAILGWVGGLGRVCLPSAHLCHPRSSARLAGRCSCYELLQTYSNNAGNTSIPQQDAQGDQAMTKVAAPAKAVQREHAEHLFAQELEALAKQDTRQRPPNW